jgi:2,3-diketo-5-methylthio-1-phosphopentane phosphatase
MKTLLVFDLDNTILANTTDYKVIDLLPECHRDDYSTSKNWATYMQKKYHLLKDHVSIDQVKQCILNMELNDGFSELFNHLRLNKHRYECIIVSGSNTLYLEWLISHHGLSDIFSNFYANIANTCEENFISISPYHKHDCDACDESICKRVLLGEYLRGREYERIFYVGDGENDMCPTTLLGGRDLVFPRVGYPLHGLIVSTGKMFCAWNDGNEILERIKEEESDF